MNPKACYVIENFHRRYNRLILQYLNFAVLAVLTSSLLLPEATAQSIYESEPINYSDSTPKDILSDFFSNPDNLKDWKYDKSRGYLESFLTAFNIPVSSQTLVFSKTSLQIQRIHPRNPRALYFGEDIHVGWVPSGKFLEVAVSSPFTGMNFYTVEREKEAPRLVRQTHECLSCHAGSITRETPGLMLRSVYPASSGHPIFKAGSHVVDQTTPLKERWGGWYTTGASMKHMGNRIYHETGNGADAGSLINLKELSNEKYLFNGSDVVALMVLEHQAQLHTLMSALTINTRRALYDQKVMDKYLERTDPVSDSTRRRIKHHADKILQCMFFADETRIPAFDLTKSAFALEFSAGGPKDKALRSLYQLQMKRRMFRYPFSYMVYSQTFNQLPPEALDYLWPEIGNILDPASNHPEYQHLKKEDKIAIREILLETHPSASRYWQ